MPGTWIDECAFLAVLLTQLLYPSGHLISRPVQIPIYFPYSSTRGHFLNNKKYFLRVLSCTQHSKNIDEDLTCTGVASCTCSYETPGHIQTHIAQTHTQTHRKRDRTLPCGNPPATRANARPFASFLVPEIHTVLWAKRFETGTQHLCLTRSMKYICHNLKLKTTILVHRTSLEPENHRVQKRSCIAQQSVPLLPVNLAVERHVHTKQQVARVFERYDVGLPTPSRTTIGDRLAQQL